MRRTNRVTFSVWGIVSAEYGVGGKFTLIERREIDGLMLPDTVLRASEDVCLFSRDDWHTSHDSNLVLKVLAICCLLILLIAALCTLQSSMRERLSTRGSARAPVKCPTSTNHCGIMRDSAVEWSCIDYLNVIVHIRSPENRRSCWHVANR